MKQRILLCPTCDQRIKLKSLPSGVRAHCRRCGSKVYERAYGDENVLLALVIAALLVYLPANLLPVVQIDLLGNLRSATIASGAITVIEAGFGLVGLAVLLTAVVAPLLFLLSVLAQLLLIRRPVAPKLLRWLLLKHRLLAKLSMVEIYLISYFVAVFKLSDFARLEFGAGSVCLVLLFIAIFYVQYEYNAKGMWQRYEQQQ
ncbi:paraquat-inducible protein A [Ferrimonas senticii]|uniref:paraquat-inducible protein A n=1 Tax=Ferrimonas senticii TaxID=394566 RepID=UPI0003F7AE4F|nr:paraquat-inducible protein A [Ferrimonas senticii]